MNVIEYSGQSFTSGNNVCCIDALDARRVTPPTTVSPFIRAKWSMKLQGKRLRIICPQRAQSIGVGSVVYRNSDLGTWCKGLHSLSMYHTCNVSKISVWTFCRRSSFQPLNKQQVYPSCDVVLPHVLVSYYNSLPFMCPIASMVSLVCHHIRERDV